MCQMAFILLVAAFILNSATLATATLDTIKPNVPTEFLLSKNSPKNKTIDLPHEINYTCEIFLNINVTDLDPDTDFIQPTENETETGEIRFTIKHPDLLDEAKKFNMIKRKEEMGWKRELFCFVNNCENISKMTFHLHAETDITAEKYVEIVPVKGNQSCMETADKQIDKDKNIWILPNEILFIVVLVSILAIIIIALLLVNPTIIQKFIQNNNSHLQNSTSTHKETKEENLEGNPMEIFSAPQDDQIKKADEAIVVCHQPIKQRIAKSNKVSNSTHENERLLPVRENDIIKKNTGRISLKNKIISLQKDIKEREDNMKKMAEIMKENENKMISLEKGMKEREDNMEKMSEIMKENENKIITLERHGTEREDNMEKMSEIMKENENKIISLEKNAKEREDNMEKMSEVIKENEVKIKEFQNKTAQLEKDATDPNKKPEIANNSLKDDFSEVDRLKLKEK